MPQLKTYPWWLTAWSAERDSDSLTPDKIRKNGVLKNARRQSDGLSLAAGCKGTLWVVTIRPHLAQDGLILLRRVLLQVIEQSVEIIETLDLDLNNVFPTVL